VRRATDPATLVGIGVALGALLVTMLLEGSSPLALFLLPPLLLVFGGTFGAAVAGSTIDDLRRLRQWTQLALTPERVPTMTERIEVLVDLAGKARREGLLALDRQLGAVRDPFLRRGLRLAVDGTDPDRLRSSLEGEIAARRTEEKVAQIEGFIKKTIPEHDLELTGEPLDREPVGHAQPRRVVGEDDVRVTELHRGHRHLLDR